MVAQAVPARNSTDSAKKILRRNAAAIISTQIAPDRCIEGMALRAAACTDSMAAGTSAGDAIPAGNSAPPNAAIGPVAGSQA